MHIWLCHSLASNPSESPYRLDTARSLQPSVPHYDLAPAYIFRLQTEELAILSRVCILFLFPMRLAASIYLQHLLVWVSSVEEPRLALPCPSYTSVHDLLQNPTLKPISSPDLQIWNQRYLFFLSPMTKTTPDLVIFCWMDGWMDGWIYLNFTNRFMSIHNFVR